MANNLTQLEKKVGELLKSGDVAWNLQKRANKARNSNKRFYGFFKFAGALIFEDGMKDAFGVAKKIGDRYVPSAFDEAKEIEKLGKYLELYENLGKTNTKAGIPTEVSKAKTMLQAKIKASTEKLDGTDKSVGKEDGANTRWKKDKDHIDTAEDVILWTYNIAKKLFDYSEERSELLVKSLENEASDPVTTEHFEMIKDTLKGVAGSLNWDKVFVEATDVKVGLDLAGRKEQYAENIKGLFFMDFVKNLKPLAFRIEEEIKKEKLELAKDSELSLAERKKLIDDIIKKFREKIASLKGEQIALNKKIEELKAEISKSKDSKKVKILEGEKKSLEIKDKKLSDSILEKEKEEIEAKKIKESVKKEEVSKV